MCPYNFTVLTARLHVSSSQFLCVAAERTRSVRHTDFAWCNLNLIIMLYVFTLFLTSNAVNISHSQCPLNKSDRCHSFHHLIFVPCGCSLLGSWHSSPRSSLSSCHLSFQMSPVSPGWISSFSCMVLTSKNEWSVCLWFYIPLDIFSLK